MRSAKSELLAFSLWCSIHIGTPLLYEILELRGLYNYLARFIWLASGLRALLHLETSRILAAGRDPESSQSSRDLFKLALVYTLAMILMAIGGLSLII